MSNPLSMFRRHQKVLLAVFGVLIMITFTVGGVITSVQRRHTGGAGASETVLTWKHGEVSEQGMADMRYAHNLTVGFLDQLIQATLDADGTPKGPGLIRDPRTGRFVDPGIPRSYAEEDLVQTMLLARKARDMGMKISEEAIFNFLDTLSDDVVPREQYGQILSNATGGRVARLQLFDQLRTELLAQNMRIIAASGTFAMSPDRAWDYFNRMNRRVTAEVLPLSAEDFKSDVSGEPSAAEIEQLYEAGKNRYPEPDSPEPGFKRRRKIAFEYLKADFEKFLENAMADVTDEQIKEYYEENKSDFKEIELPSATDDGAPPQDPESDTEPDGGPGEGDADSTDADADSPEPDVEPAPTQPESPAESSEEQAQEAAEPESPAKESEETQEQSPEQPDSSDAEDAPAEPAEGGEEESGPDLQPPSNPTPEADQPAPPAESDQSHVLPSASYAETMFVSFNAQDDAGGETDEQDESGEEETDDPPADPSGDEAAATDQEATSEPSETPEDDTATPGDQPDAAPESSPQDAGDTAAEDQPEPKPEIEAAEGAEEQSEQEVKYKPLEEVADEIRRNLARPNAQDAMNEAIKNARNDIEKYFKQQAKWEALKEDNPDLEEPVPPDPEELADKYGLVAGDTPSVDELEIADYELGKAYRFSFDQRQMARISFAQIAYTSGLPLYKADTIRSFEVDVEFLYWKVDEKEPNVPELEEVRNEVVDVWKQQQAFGVAKSEAESLAEELPGDKSLKESLDEEKAKDVVETSQFSWMTHGAMPVGYGAPMLSSVDGVQSPGPEFMESVFSLDVEEIGVAVNRPQTEVYVVRVVSESPSEDVRKQQFLGSSMTAATFHIAIAERQGFLEDWNRELEEEMEVTWNRQPFDGVEY